MIKRTRILLKITGEAFLSQDKKLSPHTINNLIGQLVQLSNTHQFGIVVGGGNFFRGNQHGKQMGITPSIGHSIGILATMMNGLMLKDLLEQQGMPVTLLSALDCPEVGEPISHQIIEKALSCGNTMVFVGGTGIPFFSTDTTAVVRALQIGAKTIWKGTNVDGIYSKDPHEFPDAQFLKELTYKQALNDGLRIMDATAFALAAQNEQTIRVFNIFAPDALLIANENQQFGSRIIV